MPNQLALVTGSSSGIGAEFARQLASRGWDLVLAARRRERLETLASQLHERHGIEAHAVPVDLTLPEEVDRLVSFCQDLDRPLDMLVNNAGFGSYGSFASLDLSRELAMVDLNVRALVALTGSFLPIMVERHKGTIIHVASTTSFQPVPYMATYAATKAFVLHFSEALSLENKGSGVRILAVCPGHTPTEFQGISGVNQRPTRTSAQSAEEVVREALEALDQGRDLIVTGWPNRLTTKLPKILPRSWFGNIVERAFRPRSPG